MLTTWLTSRPVSCWTTLRVLSGPPAENAALNLSTPTPGMLTLRSRGIESSAIRSLSGSTRSRIVVSERPGSPAPSGPRRLSEPMIRIVCGAPPSALIAQRREPVVVREALGDVGEVEQDADRGRRRDRDHHDQRGGEKARPQALRARSCRPHHRWQLRRDQRWRRWLRPASVAAAATSASPVRRWRRPRRGARSPTSAASFACSRSASATVSASIVSIGRLGDRRRRVLVGIGLDLVAKLLVEVLLEAGGEVVLPDQVLSPRSRHLRARRGRARRRRRRQILVIVHRRGRLIGKLVVVVSVGLVARRGSSSASGSASARGGVKGPTARGRGRARVESENSLW